MAPGVLVTRTGGHTPGHSVVRLASGGDRLTFAGDAVFQVGFDHPDWHNGFEHDPEEAARVRVRLLRELAANRRVAGGHSPVVPVRLPCGGRRRRLSLGTGPLGVLTACWVGPNEIAASYDLEASENSSTMFVSTFANCLALSMGKPIAEICGWCRPGHRGLWRMIGPGVTWPAVRSARKTS